MAILPDDIGSQHGRGPARRAEEVELGDRGSGALLRELDSETLLRLREE